MGDAGAIVARLKAMANVRNVAAMARFGINPDNTLGISVADLRKLAREIGRDAHRELTSEAVQVRLAAKAS